MGLHRPFDRSYYVLGGAVAKTGGSLNLVKGQLALINNCETTRDGAAVVGTLAGLAKDDKVLELRLGIDERTPNRSISNKPYASLPFSLDEVKKLKVSAPERTEISVEEVILGYNGIDDSTSFDLEVGDTYKRITVELSGNAISYLGGGTDKEIISINFEVPRVSLDECCDPATEICDPCAPIDCKQWTLDAIETLKNHQLVGGRTLGSIVEISPVFGCDTPATPTLIPYDFYCLEVCDLGDAASLAAVQAQYPNAIVKCVDRKGAISKYEMLLPQADGAPVDAEFTVASFIKGCEPCPAGTTEVPGGVVYSILLEDDGADLTAVVAAWVGADTGAVVLSATKVEGQDFGKGAYNVVFDLELSALDIEGIVTAADPDNTATFKKIGEVSSLCEDATVETIAWEVCGTCNAVEECYLITLPDTECGDSRLVELQKAYKDLVITETGVAAACQREYKAVVASNLVCDECDPVFLDSFVTEAPEEYDLAKWVYDPANVATSPEGNCKCGIRFVSKPFILKTGECLRDRINFTEDAIRIRVSGGYPDEIREGIGKIDQDIFAVTRISKYEPRTHLGGNLQDLEERDRYYFGGGVKGDYLERLLRGQESNIIDQCKQYVNYAITIGAENHSQSFAGRIAEDITYHIFVEVGRHKEVEDLLNKIAAAAGVSTVQAFGA